jgi:hypothetical protein
MIYIDGSAGSPHADHTDAYTVLRVALVILHVQALNYFLLLCRSSASEIRHASLVTD